MNALRWIVAVFIPLLIVGCRESLPLREDPSGHVAVQIRSQYETSSHSPSAGKIRLFVTIVNHTDETLQGLSDLDGRFTVTWLPPVIDSISFSVTRTIAISRNDIFYSRSFDARTGALTVSPEDSVVLSVVWDLKMNDSTYLLEHLPWKEDLGCLVALPGLAGYHPRHITDPQWFRLSATIRPFRVLAVMNAAPVTVRHCLMGKHDGELYTTERPPCADLTKFDPCSLIK